MSICMRPIGTTMPLSRLTSSDIERAAYGAEEIGEHRFTHGACIHCGEPMNRAAGQPRRCTVKPARVAGEERGRDE